MPAKNDADLPDHQVDDRAKTWEVKSSSGTHLDVLDGIRGVAILMVVAYHTLYTNPEHGYVARTFGYVVRGGWIGVPIFFVLSGFLISFPFFKGRDSDPSFWCPRGYGWRRLAKIIPPYYLSIVLFLGFYWYLYRDPAYFDAAWKWATGLANFILIPVPFNVSYWSLIVEVHFYVALPLLFWLTRGLSVRRTAFVLFGTFLIVPIVARYFVWPHGLYALPPFPAVVHQDVAFKLTRFPCQLDYFAWGVAFAGAYVPLSEAGASLRPLSIFGYAGVALMSVTVLYWGYWGEHFNTGSEPTRWSEEIGHLLPSCAAMLMLFFVFDRECLGSRWLSASWLRFVGIVSYEWFLFHGPIVAWFHQNNGPSHGSILAYLWRSIVPLIVTFVFSVAVYRWFSLPIMNHVRSRLRPSPVRI